MRGRSAGKLSLWFESRAFDFSFFRSENEKEDCMDKIFIALNGTLHLTQHTDVYVSSALVLTTTNSVDLVYYYNEDVYKTTLKLLPTSVTLKKIFNNDRSYGPVINQKSKQSLLHQYYYEHQEKAQKRFNEGMSQALPLPDSVDVILERHRENIKNEATRILHSPISRSKEKLDQTVVSRSSAIKLQLNKLGEAKKFVLDYYIKPLKEKIEKTYPSGPTQPNEFVESVTESALESLSKQESVLKTQLSITYQSIKELDALAEQALSNVIGSKTVTLRVKAKLIYAMHLSAHIAHEALRSAKSAEKTSSCEKFSRDFNLFATAYPTGKVAWVGENRSGSTALELLTLINQTRQNCLPSSYGAKLLQSALSMVGEINHYEIITAQLAELKTERNEPLLTLQNDSFVFTAAAEKILAIESATLISEIQKLEQQAQVFCEAMAIPLDIGNIDTAIAASHSVTNKDRINDIFKEYLSLIKVKHSVDEIAETEFQHNAALLKLKENFKNLKVTSGLQTQLAMFLEILEDSVLASKRLIQELKSEYLALFPKEDNITANNVIGTRNLMVELRERYYKIISKSERSSPQSFNEDLRDECIAQRKENLTKDYFKLFLLSQAIHFEIMAFQQKNSHDILEKMRQGQSIAAKRCQDEFPVATTLGNAKLDALVKKINTHLDDFDAATNTAESYQHSATESYYAFKELLHSIDISTDITTLATKLEAIQRDFYSHIELFKEKIKEQLQKNDRESALTELDTLRDSINGRILLLCGGFVDIIKNSTYWENTVTIRGQALDENDPKHVPDGIKLMYEFVIRNESQEIHWSINRESALLLLDQLKKIAHDCLHIHSNYGLTFVYTFAKSMVRSVQAKNFYTELDRLNLHDLRQTIPESASDYIVQLRDRLAIPDEESVPANKLGAAK